MKATSHRPARRSRRAAAGVLALVVSGLVCALGGAAGPVSAAGPVGPAGTAGAAGGTPLIGTFRLQSGTCEGGRPSGSYIRMVLPNGTATGPFLSNSDSTCRDQTYTPLRAGVDGGLSTGGFQQLPSPAFDAEGNALARRITEPAAFYGTGFATASNPVDPQTGTAVRAPVITATGRTLSADLRSFAVVWNDQHFNQGSPKPDGSYPGSTRAARGTYDPTSGAFTLEWTSQIVGGAFDRFTGLWHLQGAFVAASPVTSAPPVAQPDAEQPAAPAAGDAPSAVATAGGGSPSTRGSADGPAGRVPAVVQQPTGTVPAGQVPVIADPQGRPVASTSTITSESWTVRWELVALSVALALGGFLALGLLQRRVAAASTTQGGAA